MAPLHCPKALSTPKLVKLSIWSWKAQYYTTREKKTLESVSPATTSRGTTCASAVWAAAACWAGKEPFITTLTICYLRTNLQQAVRTLMTAIHRISALGLKKFCWTPEIHIRFIWEFIIYICLLLSFPKRNSIITGWIKLWEAAALLLFLHLLQPVGLKSWEPGTDVTLSSCSTGWYLAAWIWEMLPVTPVWFIQWMNHLMQLCGAFSPSLFLLSSPVPCSNTGIEEKDSNLPGSSPCSQFTHPTDQTRRLWGGGKQHCCWSRAWDLAALGGTKSYSDGSLLPALPLHGSKELRACKPRDVCARAQLTRSACSVNLELSGRAGQAAYM